MPKAALHNLGCKVNAYETEAMEQQLRERGFEIVPFDQEADVYIINTCSVTNIADRKSRQMLHRAKKMNPKAAVVAVGCYVQVASDVLKEDASVDIMIGNNKKKELADIVEQYLENSSQEKQLWVADIAEETWYEDLNLGQMREHTRAFIKVQDGCNQFCSYCIIPYARGRVRSRAEDEVVCEVRKLMEKGYREVVLTGIHLSSYGVDHMGESPVRGGDWDHRALLSLIQAVHEVPGLERIRLGSLEPRIITEEFAESLKMLPKFCAHFHLSLQSGCDATLKRMNRHYTTQDYEKRCQILRKHFEHPAITTDVIVGFPGETEEEFACTKAFLEQIGFYEMHVFQYSRREGTKAASMKDQVSDQIKHLRSSQLLELEKAMSRTYRKNFLEKEISVLFEEAVLVDGTWYMTGYTPQYVKAAVPIEAEEKKKKLAGKLFTARGEALLAEDMLKVQMEID